MILLGLLLEGALTDHFLDVLVRLEHVVGYGCASLDELTLELVIERLFPTVGRQSSLVLSTQMFGAFPAGFAAAAILHVSCLHRCLPTEGVPKPPLELASLLFSLSRRVLVLIILSHVLVTAALEEQVIRFTLPVAVFIDRKL